MRITALLLCSLIASVSQLIAQRITHTELLGGPTDHSISLQMSFDDPVEMCVQYGTTQGSLTQQTPWTAIPAGDPRTVVVDGLLPNTQYYYRVCYREPGAATFTARSEYRFHTQRSPGSTFAFVVQADPHVDEQSDTDIYRRCLLNQLEDGPDFMIDLGDILMSDKLKNTSGKLNHDTITYRSHLMRSFYELSGHSVPLFIALGNHEGEAGWQLNGTAENVAVWGTGDRKRFFVNPEPNEFYSGDTTHYAIVGQRNAYYSWEWGDAQFIVLDPYWFTKPKPDSLNGWRWTLGKAQYDWLKSTLEKSSAKYRFVFAHQLIGGDPDGRGGVEFADLYEWGGKNLDGTDGFAKNRPGWYKPIKDLLSEHRVTIFFHGHDHFFGKQDKDCLVYQETPQPSHPNFSNAGQADDYGYYEGQILPNSGHLRVTVSPEGVKVEYVRVYVPRNETGNRRNKDISATYFIGSVNCYDSLSTGLPVLWNSDYADELVFPNPSSSDISIRFTATMPDRVSLSILDSQGRTVRTLIAGSLVDEGSYTVVWDGRDSSGNTFSSGVYWYSLQGDHRDESFGRLILSR